MGFLRRVSQNRVSTINQSNINLVINLIYQSMYLRTFREHDVPHMSRMHGFGHVKEHDGQIRHARMVLAKK